jgi:hypothetical protein
LHLPSSTSGLLRQGLSSQTAPSVGGRTYSFSRSVSPWAAQLAGRHAAAACELSLGFLWNAGEAAGRLAAFCSARRTLPRAVRADPELLAEFLGELEAAGVKLARPPGVAAY